MCEEYIEYKENKYIIKREFNNIEYQFAVCNTLDEAVLKVKKLNDEGWPIKTEQYIIDEDRNRSSKFDEMDCYDFDIKVGKSYKHRFLVVSRVQTYDLFPKMEYENGCEIILDGIKSKAKLNFVPRIVIDGKNEILRSHLKELSEINPNQRKIVKLIKKEENFDKDISELITENKKLKEKNSDLINKLDKIEKKLNELSHLLK